ncbi:hypothetical protein V6N13_124533 [Hibiscus sabdariffa]
MPPRRETRANAGLVAEGQNDNEPLPLRPPIPHFPPASRGAGGVPQAPQGAQFWDWTSIFQAPVARVHV